MMLLLLKDVFVHGPMPLSSTFILPLPDICHSPQKKIKTVPSVFQSNILFTILLATRPYKVIFWERKRKLGGTIKEKYKLCATITPIKCRT